MNSRNFILIAFLALLTQGCGEAVNSKSEAGCATSELPLEPRSSEIFPVLFEFSVSVKRPEIEDGLCAAVRPSHT